jgi:hypothetical protein
MSFFSSFGGFPFGGFHGAQGDDDGTKCIYADREEVDNTTFYKLLEVSKTASQD